MTRREFLSITTAASTAALAGCVTSESSSPEIIDTHTHFYDPTRPQGVPWPPKDDAVLYRPVYPDEFKRLARPHGVTGTVVVEASPWVEDNQWVLDLAARYPFLLGMVGNLAPGRPEFATQLRRFAANPLFRGLRIGSAELTRAASDAATRRDLHLLADRDLALDVLCGPDELPRVAQLAAAIPDLRIVVDHCANVRLDGQAPPATWRAGLRACAAQRHVFLKGSGLVEGTGRADGSAPAEAAFYRPTLDAVWETFGADRVIYGSNWPVSARFASYATVFGIVNEYFTARGPTALKKYLAGNARIAYKLRHR